MPKYIEYRDTELRVGMVIDAKPILRQYVAIWGRYLTITDLVFRAGHGLQVYTQLSDGVRSGPMFSPHPDDMVRVISAPSHEEIPSYVHTDDYPHARKAS